jgi:hypothetical protein
MWKVLGLKHRVNYLECKLNIDILSENIPHPLPDSSQFIIMSFVFIVSVRLKWKLRILEQIAVLKIYVYPSFLPL